MLLIYTTFFRITKLLCLGWCIFFFEFFFFLAFILDLSYFNIVIIYWFKFLRPLWKFVRVCMIENHQSEVSMQHFGKEKNHNIWLWIVILFILILVSISLRSYNLKNCCNKLPELWSSCRRLSICPFLLFLSLPPSFSLLPLE